jgi:hypothetical protein
MNAQESYEALEKLHLDAWKALAEYEPTYLDNRTDDSIQTQYQSLANQYDGLEANCDKLGNAIETPAPTRVKLENMSEENKIYRFANYFSKVAVNSGNKSIRSELVRIANECNVTPKFIEYKNGDYTFSIELAGDTLMNKFMLLMGLLGIKLQ